MNSNSSDIKQTLENFLYYWKWILISVLFSLIFAFLYLRYTTFEYNATATIKIQDEEQSKKLPSLEDLSNKGLFSDGADKIKDELITIKSRTIAKNIIKKLELNILYYAEGDIKDIELYKNSPVTINFFASDSVIDNVFETIHIKILSNTKYLLIEDDKKSFLDKSNLEGREYTFGDKVETKYGGYVIIPNVDSELPLTRDLFIKIDIIPTDILVNIYTEKVEIASEPGSTILKLNIKETVAQKAIDYLNQLITEYNNDVLADKEKVVKVTSEFINNRLEQVSEELGKVESDAEQVQKQNNLTALGTQTELNLQARKQVDQQITQTSTNIQMISYLQDEINDKSKMSDLLPADIGIGDANTAQIVKSHNELVVQRDKILRNSSSKNPVIIELNNQIKALKINLQNSLQTIKETSELTLNNLTAESNRISGQLYSAPTKARKFRGIQRQQSIKETLYLFLLEKREESAIRLGMDSPIAKTIDKAYSSFLPISPNTKMTYIASFILGLFIPIGLIYMISLLDTKIYNKNDLLNTVDIPYLGDIPKSSKKQKLIKKVDYSAKAEAFRLLRANIDFLLKDKKDSSKKLFITSTKAQEGKSHTSTNLASSISFSNKSVLLIEMDIRVPKILDYLEIIDKPKKGLTDYIVDKTIKPQSVVYKHKDNSFLDIIPSGTIPPNPSELLMSDRVTELFEYFDDKYDYIIADTSAVGLVSDTFLISHFADIFIYVVSADNVDKRQLVHVAQPLHDEGRLPNINMLLNGVKQGAKGYGYGYGYGYGNSPAKNKKKWYKIFS
ncbi:MAG: polysaccharide biosynthesis tyrosine autokinase [Winogradskyella sp.]|uniref:GumC family protein n=1 Tax=Winogradskyella sp. TaxID=1883156 RepID=UPI0025FA5F90|nr:tyrosine-protein kinase family protein [Winogradskyella sp.]NRB58900.1 polysaccharide biosynthesis tyrosine autokinase [Winogradskyella sp.]